MMSLLARRALVLFGFCVAATAQAQNMPPLPGSTPEYRAAAEMARAEQKRKAQELLLAACKKQDAAGCFYLGQYFSEDLKAVRGMPAEATPWRFVDQSLTLAKRWCVPDKGIDEGCETYRLFLSDPSRVSSDRKLEGGRALAKYCFAGKSRATDCSYVETLLAGAPAEQSALAAWVDEQFEAGCASGDNNVCNQGFFRQWGGITEDLRPRLAKLVDASVTGCNAGAPRVCFEAAAFLAKFADSGAYPLAADFFGAACKLPPRPGEEDVREASCKNEAIVRAAIGKGP